jgi:anti-sigma regulatory factor (Ser/Thr protein kinase)
LKNGAANFTPKISLSKNLVNTVRHVLEMSHHVQVDSYLSSQPVSCNLAFVLENDIKLVGPLIEHLQGSMPSWSDRDRLQIGMALDEAIVNAMHHGNLEVESSLRDNEHDEYYELIRKRNTQLPYCDRRVRIQAEFSDQHMCVQISDEGPGFDPSSIPDPTQAENLHKCRGRGLFLIRSFMDQVAHNRSGNQITMTKFRPTGDR